MTQTPRASAPPSEPAASHPSPTVLIAYHRDELTEAEADGVREHVVDCESCLQTVLTMGEMEEDLRVAEPVEDPAMLRSLERLRQRRTEERGGQAAGVEAPAARPWRVEPPAPPVAVPAARRGGVGHGWAQAALVLLCVGLGGLSMSQRQEIERLSRPVGNFESIRFSVGSNLRGADRVRLGRESGGLQVVIRIGVEVEHESYRAELVAKDGESAGSLSGLGLEPGGALRLFFPRRGLQTGAYVLEIFGVTESGAETLLDTLRFQVEVEG